MAESPSELNYDQVRNLSAAERVDRYQAWVLQRQTSEPTASTTVTRWQVVDRDMTPDQIADLPEGRPGESRTPVLWLKFWDGGRREVVVARGRFDFEAGTWTARLSSIEDGDSKARVVPIEWARIVVGERPWDGPTIRRNEADPW
jgi:hypothetical protein